MFFILEWQEDQPSSGGEYFETRILSVSFISSSWNVFFDRKSLHGEFFMYFIYEEL